MAIIILAVIYLTFVSMGLPDSVLGSSFPAISENLGLMADQGGLIAMIVSAGTVVSSLASSWLLKRIRTPLLVGLSVLMTAVALVCFAFVTAAYTWAFYLIAILLGIGGGGIDAALNNYVALNYKAIHMNWLHCSWGIGVTTSPLIIGHFIDPGANSAGWQKGVLLISFLQLGLCAIVFLSLPLWNRVAKAKNEQPAKDPGRANAGGPKPTLREMGIFGNPVFYLAMVGFFCYCALENTTGLWIASYFNVEKGLDTNQSAMITSMFYIGLTIGRFLAGVLSLKLNEKTLIRIGEGILAGGILVVFLPLPVSAAIAGFALIGLGCAPIYPAIIRSTPYRFSRTFSQNAMGLEMAFAYVGNMSIPPLFGVVAEAAGKAFYLLPAVLSVLLVVMVGCHEAVNRLLARRDRTLAPEQRREYTA